MARPPESDAPQTPPDLIELGALRGAYGVKGWVHVQPYSADATVLRASRQWWLLDAAGASPLAITAVRRHGDHLVAKWEGCDNPEAADRLRGMKVAVARSSFPAADPGEVYWIDLIGARVINRQGIELGTVTSLQHNGAQALIEVGSQSGSRLIPLVERHVDRVDVERREVRVDWELDW